MSTAVRGTGPASTDVPGRILMKGNEAIAEAAIQAGCDAYFGYPITPQAEILEWSRDRIAGYKRPRSVTFLRENEMPRTATGKILHRELRARFAGPSTERDPSS